MTNEYIFPIKKNSGGITIPNLNVPQQKFKNRSCIN